MSIKSLLKNEGWIPILLVKS